MNASLSCVILTANNHLKGNCLDACVVSLLNQIGANFELIIVDAGKKRINQRRIQNLVNNHSGKFKPNLEIISVGSTTSRGRGRNIGAAKATGDILLFIDDDTILINKNSLSFIALNSKKFSHGYGARRLWTEGKWFNLNSKKVVHDLQISNYDRLLRHSHYLVKSTRLDITPEYLNHSFISNFGFVSRKLFKSVGGFPNYEGYGFEDNCLSFKIYLRSKKFLSLNTLQVVHVNHSVKSSILSKKEKNKLKYFRLLKSYGYRRFNISRLMGVPSAQSRPILQKYSK